MWPEAARVFEQHCVACHNESGIAPMSLRTFDQARPWAKSIARVVRAGEMPPWHAEGAPGTWRDDPRLSDVETGVVLGWADGGAPKGAVDYECALPRESRLEGGNVVEFVFPAFAPEPGGEDTWKTLLADRKFDDDFLIDAIEIVPDNRRTLHHAGIFYVSEQFVPETERVLDTAAEESLGIFRERQHITMGLYLPGSSYREWPSGYADLIPAQSRLVVAAHYGPQTESSEPASIVVRARRAPARAKVIPRLITIGAQKISIAPNEAGYRWSKTETLEHPMLLHAIQTHMHLRGQSCRAVATLPDGTVETLLAVPRYDFHWQRTYWYTEPRQLPAGTKVEVELQWDNSAANPFNPDPSAAVVFGAGTEDEMGNVNLFWTGGEPSVAVE